jgi:D-glycero-D-manno-heptose 1,7-bisphosphate phosphatase
MNNLINRAVFLDRDGVINKAVIRDRKPYSPATVNDLEIPDDVPQALAALKKRGFKLIVVTNQPDVARGKQSRESVEEINAKLLALLPLDDIRVCYHTDSDKCTCRKPGTGMLTEAAKTFSINLGQSFMVGDRWRDIDAGRAAGCQTIWIENDYDEEKPRNPDMTAKTLWDAAQEIISKLPAVQKN